MKVSNVLKSTLSAVQLLNTTFTQVGVRQYPFFVYANNKGSREFAHAYMRGLAFLQ